MAYEVGTAYLTVLPDAKGFATGLGSQIDGPFSDAGRRGGASLGAGVGTGGAAAMGSSGRALGAVFVAAFAAIGASQIVDAVVGWVSEAVTAASNLVETQNKVNEIFGSGADGVVTYSKTASSRLGQSQQTFLNGAATVGIFGKSAGLAGEELAGFSTGMVELATDLASFNNTSPEEAIDAIGSALRGESEPIRRYGVLLDEATLKNRALAMGLTTTTTEALTPQQRVLAAHAEILAQTGTAQGDFARTADEYANQQRTFTAEMEDFQATVGETILPVVSDLFEVFRDVGMPILEKISDWFTENPEVIRTFILAFLTSGLQFIDALLAMAQGLGGFGFFFFDVMRSLTDAFLSFVGFFVDGAARAFGWLPEIGDNLTTAQEDFAEFRDGVNEKFDAMKGVGDLWMGSIELSRTSVEALRDSIEDLNGTTATITINTDWRNPAPTNLNTAAAIYSATGGQRAGGGPVSPGESYIVGERSWELFVPDRPGTIYNPQQLAAMAGAGGAGGDTFYITEQSDPEGTAYAVQRRQQMRRA